MTLPNIFAALTAPQMVFLDQNFNAVSALGIVPCTASGTNLITLTPNSNTPTISAYANYQLFSFVVVNTTNGAVTAQVGALAALPVFLADGTTQASNGTLQKNFLYVVAFNQAVNSGVGGFVIINGLINQTSSTIASGGTVAIGAAATDYITISGTSSIASFDTVISGTRRVLTFSSGATLLNSASLILPGGQNISTAPGHTAIVESESPNWRFISYFPPSAAFKQPTYTTFTGGSGATYTPPTGAIRINVKMIGGGGGSGGSGTSGATNGSGGGTTNFSTLFCPGGQGGGLATSTGGPASGTSNAPGGGTFSFTVAGASGGAGANGLAAGGVTPGTPGGASILGGFAQLCAPNGNPGISPVNNTGAGASGSSATSTVGGSGGATAGAYGEFQLSSPLASSYLVTVGSGGVAGAAGVSGLNGAKGSDGIVIIQENYY